MNNIYSGQLEKCAWKFHTPMNQQCRNLELGSKMYKVREGLVCVRCYNYLYKLNHNKVKQTEGSELL